MMPSCLLMNVFNAHALPGGRYGSVMPNDPYKPM